jgi:type 2 lantibiotic biosynthesis protein LanM
MKGQTVRFLFRPTAIYHRLLEKCLEPSSLRSGVAWSVEMERLARAFVTTRDKPAAWAIVDEELRSMQRLDIPYLATNTDSDALTVQEGQRIEGYFDSSGYERFLSRLRALDEADLERQLGIIRQSIGTRAPPGTGGETLAPRRHPPDSLIDDAQAIGLRIQQRAFWIGPHDVNWLGPSYDVALRRFQASPLGDSLYDGRCGVALFLAALDFVTGQSVFRDVVLGAIRPVRRRPRGLKRDSLERWITEIGIGGGTGVGSILYSLAKISRFLADKTLLDDGVGVAKAITVEHIENDRGFDVMGGAAGAILGLLAIHAESSDPSVLETAQACGRHLLAYRRTSPGMPGAWRSSGSNRPLSGFAHGTAGISYSLLRLYAVVGNDEYLAAAREDFQYEERTSHMPKDLLTWCHGRPGLGLARVAVMPILGQHEATSDVETCLEQTLHGSNPVDHVCCGNFGRLETLLVGSRVLRRAHLLESARRQARSLVMRAGRNQGYQMSGELDANLFCPNPAFFQGEAGIGYELLRLARPDDLPSVLLWE